MIIKFLIIVMIAVYTAAVPTGDAPAPLDEDKYVYYQKFLNEIKNINFLILFISFHSIIPAFSASKMTVDCEEHLKALKLFENKHSALANLVKPITPIFQKIIGQLNHDDVKLIGQTAGAAPFSQFSLFIPLKMAEKCDEHIATIKGYIIDLDPEKPKSASIKSILEPIVKDFEAVIGKLEQPGVELTDNMEIRQIPDMLKQVSFDVRAFNDQLIKYVDTIIRVYADYDRKLRARKFVEGDMVFGKCMRKLKYVQAEVGKNAAKILKDPKSKGQMETDLTDAVYSLSLFRGLMKQYEIPAETISYYFVSYAKSKALLVTIRTLSYSIRRMDELADGVW